MLQPKITKVELMQDYKLRLDYETGERKMFDVAPYIIGDWYGRLKEPFYFNTVRILPGGSGIEWPEGQDIAPHELYDAGVDAC